ncbi:hypothetical protein TNIN_60311 [Trichonephila inaurata madagascariensis]|uniref:Amino acid transporter transmembrane domain-containing protein n=1 Tax=Trichonephila inaurata madagascariensis TaxID=2747483 RepID=A0A8X6WKW6_9ARAC|nr:hypothetical protein TNIN_60311 [Trichonephila inaurata madagascariensis]
MGKNQTEKTHLIRRDVETNYGCWELPDFESDDPEEVEKKPKEKKKTSNTGTFLHIIKGNIGTGILAMPMAISNFGLMAGIIGIIVLGIICIYCMQLLIFSNKIVVAEKKERMQQKAQSQSVAESGYSTIGISSTKSEVPSNSENKELETDISLDYANTAYEAFKYGPQIFQPMASFMKGLINALLVATQFGFCCVYFLFVGQSLHEVSLNMKVFTTLDAKTITAIILPFMVFLNFIPNLDSLTSVSTTAIGLQVVGLLMMLMYFFNGPFSDNFIPYITPFTKWPLFFGTALFSFEGIGVVLPLENEMKKKRSFKTIVNSGMTVVVCLYLLIGICGYLKYGMNVRPSITFNLPVGCFSEVIRLLFALAIFLSYPLQIFIIIPAFIHAVTISKYRIRCKKLLIGIDIFLSIFGVFGLIVGSITSISEMIHRNTTEVALSLASYNELMYSEMPGAISILNSKNGSCCTLYH